MSDANGLAEGITSRRSYRQLAGGHERLEGADEGILLESAERILRGQVLYEMPVKLKPCENSSTDAQSAMADR
jgi:hypothetical protein